jgi:adenylate cyclase
MSETRKLAAILVADVVGYSRLAGTDEDRILARLRTLRGDLIDPTIAVHHGRVVKHTGDGARQAHRVSHWHQGDVSRRTAMMGDGVNNAARLQGVAKPGAICRSEQAYQFEAVTEEIRDELRGLRSDLARVNQIEAAIAVERDERQ